MFFWAFYVKSESENEIKSEQYSYVEVLHWDKFNINTTGKYWLKV